MTPDIQALLDQLAAASQDARKLASELTGEQGIRRPADGGWSVSECLDHLAITNREYLRAMRQAADRARAEGRLRRGPARPGLLGGWFARLVEPPARPGFRIKAPQSIVPRNGVTLSEATVAFLAVQEEVSIFLRINADLDLTGVAFANPFIPGIRFSLATGLNIVLAHERRHLWQARRACQLLTSIRSGDRN